MAPLFLALRLGYRKKKIAVKPLLSEVRDKMPQLDDANERLMGTGRKAQTTVRRFWDGFSDFLLQDNVLEVTVGLIIAAAFTTVVKSFISDIISPVLSLLPFIERNFDEKFAVLVSLLGAKIAFLV